MSTTDSRTIEKLIALLRYETDIATSGISSGELLEEMLAFARELVLNEDCPDDPTDADLARIDRAAVTLMEYMLRGLIAAGHVAGAERFVEKLATDRRRCRARFGGGPEQAVPLTPEERETLAAEWDRQGDESSSTEALPS